MTFPAFTEDVNRKKPGSLWSEWSESVDQTSIKKETEWEEDDEVPKCECDLQMTQVNNKLRRVINQLNTTINSLDTKYFILKENYLDLKDENKVLKQNISVSKENNDKLLSENCKLNQTLKDYQVSKDNLMGENTKLQKEIDDLNLKISKLNKKIDDINEENAQLWNFTTKVSKQIVPSRNRTESVDSANIQWNLAELQSLQDDMRQYKVVLWFKINNNFSKYLNLN